MSALACDGDLAATWEELRRRSALGVPVALTGLDALAPAEAGALLAFFLHDPGARGPIEPFATLLAAMLHKRETGLWDLHAEGPARDAEARFLQTLPADQPQCLACACFPLCQGYGAWAGSCATWRLLLTGLAKAARDLARLRRTRRSPSGGAHVR